MYSIIIGMGFFSFYKAELKSEDIICTQEDQGVLRCPFRWFLPGPCFHTISTTPIPTERSTHFSRHGCDHLLCVVPVSVPGGIVLHVGHAAGLVAEVGRSPVPRPWVPEDGTAGSCWTQRRALHPQRLIVQLRDWLHGGKSTRHKASYVHGTMTVFLCFDENSKSTTSHTHTCRWCGFGVGNPLPPPNI